MWAQLLSAIIAAAMFLLLYRVLQRRAGRRGDATATSMLPVLIILALAGVVFLAGLLIR